MPVHTTGPQPSPTLAHRRRLYPPGYLFHDHEYFPAISAG
jgi:hypothetical protein